MCGIVGYVGARQAAGILLDGLERLEYRGYDSAGIAVTDGHEITIEKTAGRLTALRAAFMEKGLPVGTVGIGHTRWATHGAPTQINAHPHRSGNVTLVHNGIIENHTELRAFLQRHGVTLCSETDTACIAALMAWSHRGDPRETIARVCPMLKGSYALAILFDDVPERLFAVRHESPLIIGEGNGERFVASDIPAILPDTRRYHLLGEGEICVLSAQEARFYGLGGDEIENPVLTAEWDINAAEKGGFDHFMLKEIYEEPEALQNTVRSRAEGGIEALFEEELRMLGHPARLHIVACGSALHAGLIGKYAIERYARVPVCVEVASEFRYGEPILTQGDAVIVISQSGETADTVAALRHAKNQGTPTLGIVNVVGSTVAREADAVVYTMAGPEIAVATTKAYLCQTAILLLLAIKLSYCGGHVTADRAHQLLTELLQLPGKIRAVLGGVEDVKRLAALYSGCHDFFFVGRGQDREICAEASLKLKEISYVHSEAYAAGELKHGTISLITSGTPVAGIITEEQLEPKTAANLREVKTRGASVLLVRAKGGEKPEYCDELLEVPKTDVMLMPLTAIVPLQLFAYYMAVARGCDVDKPRNLAKSVTVE